MNPAEKQNSGSRDLYEYWSEQLAKEEKAHKSWRSQARDVEKLFLSEKEGRADSVYNLFWSNVQIIHAAVYAQTAKPDVRRRHDGGDIEKQASQVIERALGYIVDTTNFDANIDSCVDNYLVTALGVPRLRYKPLVSRDENGMEFIANQTIELESFPFSRFHFQPCSAWEKCDWIAFDHMLDKRAVEKKYGVEPEHLEMVSEQEKVLVREIYSKPKKEIIVMAKGIPRVLERRKDALGLQGFYPCPKPLFSNLALGKSIPKPDYKIAEPQYKQLNRLNLRISALVRAIKDVGFYDDQMKDLALLENATDGQLIPVSNLIDRLNNTNQLEAVIAKMPIDDRARVIQVLREEQNAKKQEIYEIFGISDIVRGVSQASETATAQQIKGNWANVRIGRRQKRVATFVRDIFRIMAEIISEHFEPEILTQMTGIEVTEDIQALLANDVTRNFAIDVETDSTIAKDEQEERAQKLEMLQKVTEYLQGVWPMAKSGQISIDLAKDMLLMVVRSFKHGRQLEDSIEQMESADSMIQQLQQQSEQLQQQLQQMQGQSESMQQQYDQQLQQLQQQLAQFSERDESRKDAETQANVQLKGSQAQKNLADAMSKTTPLPAPV